MKYSIIVHFFQFSFSFDDWASSENLSADLFAGSICWLETVVAVLLSFCLILNKSRNVRSISPSCGCLLWTMTLCWGMLAVQVSITHSAESQEYSENTLFFIAAVETMVVMSSNKCERWHPEGGPHSVAAAVELKNTFLLIPLIDCRVEVWANEGCSLVSHAVCCSGELWSHAWSCSRGCRVVRVAKKVKVGRAGVRRDPDWPVTSCSPSHWSLVDALSMPILEPSDALPARGLVTLLSANRLLFLVVNVSIRYYYI